MQAIVCGQSSFLIQNNVYVTGFYHFMHISYTFAQAELVKVVFK